MHYIPSSTTEMLGGTSQCSGVARSNFHYQSAPLYLLTLIVGGLLVADWVLTAGMSNVTGSLNSDATLFSYRLALLAAMLGGARILYHTLDGLLSGRFGADLALTVACLAAIAVGEHQTAGLVVFISLVGESIEGYTVDRARAAIHQTFDLWPAIAHRRRDDREDDIPVEQVLSGDVVVVRPGERVPVDGQVISGLSEVDQSPFTGESIPVAKQAGDRVFAGTTNRFGALIVLTESTGDATALANVAQLVTTAASRKAELEKTADRLARWFLPAVLIAALATLVGWRIAAGTWRAGILPALGVLVVACPCPLILATPCAVMAALAWLARRGVVVKGSAVLERLAAVDTFAFDKTGTLTQGALAMGEIVPIGNHGPEQVLRIAAIAERNSEHLLARILMKAAEQRGLPIPFSTDFQTIAGAGIQARISRRDLLGEASSNDTAVHEGDFATIVVGNRRALDHCNIAFSHEAANLLKDREVAGELPLVVAVDGVVIGLIGIKETVRPESRLVLEELRRIGITRFALLTGDRSQAAEAVVRSTGLFADVLTEQLPADKSQWVEAARQSGRKVAMVGDGINDAPALAVADVGVALGSAGGNLSAAAGDIILLGDPLRPLPGLVRLSRALVENVWQSIVLFAFGLNGLGVLICSFGWLNPIGGALFHEVASLLVMANSMRLLWFDGWATSSRRLDWILPALDRLAISASPSRWVFWFIEHSRLFAKLTVPVGLAAWLLSGVVLLTEDEQAVVTRYGRYQTTLNAGLYWRWPWPLEKLTRVKTRQVRSVEIGYRTDTDIPKKSVFGTATNRWTSRFNRKNGSDQVTQTNSSVRLIKPIVEWTSSHDGRERSGVNEESMVLTADEVPVELMAEVQYRVSDLRAFLFVGSRKPDEILRATAENILREIAVNASLESLLTEQRVALERLSLAKLRERIANYGLGVEVLDLQWLDVHPPQAVVPAYRQVADALEERELLVNEAQAYAIRTLLASVGERAFAMLRTSAAGGEAGRDEPGDRTDWQLTDELWQRLVTADRDGQVPLSGNAAAIRYESQAESIRREQSAIGASQKFERLLAEFRRYPGLTSNYLYWTAMGNLLSQRSLTIIDPKAAGRQQLWMGDPTPRLMMPPVEAPPEKEPVGR